MIRSSLYFNQKIKLENLLGLTRKSVNWNDLWFWRKMCWKKVSENEIIITRNGQVSLFKLENSIIFTNCRKNSPIWDALDLFKFKNLVQADLTYQNFHPLIKLTEEQIINLIYQKIKPTQILLKGKQLKIEKDQSKFIIYWGTIKFSSTDKRKNILLLYKIYDALLKDSLDKLLDIFLQ